MDANVWAPGAVSALIDSGLTFPADKVAVLDNGNLFVGTEVETILTELLTALRLAAVTNGDGASLIGIEDSGGLFTGTTVEDALAEAFVANTALETDLADVANGEGASKIGVEDAAGYTANTTVETVLAEIMLLLLTVTAGTVSASKALVVDANKDLTGLRDLAITGDLSVTGDPNFGILQRVTNNSLVQITVSSTILAGDATLTTASGTALTSQAITVRKADTKIEINARVPVGASAVADCALLLHDGTSVIQAVSGYVNGVANAPVLSINAVIANPGVGVKTYYLRVIRLSAATLYSCRHGTGATYDFNNIMKLSLTVSEFYEG